jgi:hypothetical protein
MWDITTGNRRSFVDLFKFVRGDEDNVNYVCQFSEPKNIPYVCRFDMLLMNIQRVGT